MCIDVNIHSTYGERGQIGFAYEPVVTIMSECRERLDPIALERLSKTLENAIRDGIEEARIKENGQ